MEVWRCGGTKDNKRKRHGAKNNGVSNEFWCAPMQIIDKLHVSWVLCVLASLPFIRALFLSFFPPPLSLSLPSSLEQAQWAARGL